MQTSQITANIKIIPPSICHLSWPIPTLVLEPLPTPRIAAPHHRHGLSRRKLLCFPRGNGSPGALSLYVLAAGAEDLPEGSCRWADFKLTLINKDPSHSIQKGAGAASGFYFLMCDM